MLFIGPGLRRPLRALLLGPLLFAALAAPAGAAEDPDNAPGERPPIALRLSPAVLDIPLQPGPAEHELRVDNLGSQPVTVVTQLSEFTVTEDGTTHFRGPDEVSATAWADLDVDTFELAPDQRRDVTLTVDVPDDAEPGERYLSVIFAVPGDPDSDGNITVTHRVAVKLYVEVPGQRIEHLELGELTGPRLIDTGPATFELTVHNRGNVHRRFEADGRVVATSGDDEFPFPNFTVLGDSTRVVETVWADPPLLCWCVVAVAIDDGQGKLVTASTQVIAFPLRLSLALVALTAGLALLAAAHRRRRTARLGTAARDDPKRGRRRPIQPDLRPDAPARRTSGWSSPAAPRSP